MCLAKVTKIGGVFDKAYLAPFTGWKVFRRRESPAIKGGVGYNAPFRPKGFQELGEWYTAQEDWEFPLHVPALNGRYYEVGFHAYATREGALKYLKFVQASCDDHFVVVKCKFRGFLAAGEQRQTGRRVVKVWAQMMLEGEDGP